MNEKESNTKVWKVNTYAESILFKHVKKREGRVVKTACKMAMKKKLKQRNETETWFIYILIKK